MRSRRWIIGTWATAGPYAIKCIHLCCLLIGLNTLQFFCDSDWVDKSVPRCRALQLKNERARREAKERNLAWKRGISRPARRSCGPRARSFFHREACRRKMHPCKTRLAHTFITRKNPCAKLNGPPRQASRCFTYLSSLCCIKKKKREKRRERERDYTVESLLPRLSRAVKKKNCS